MFLSLEGGEGVGKTTLVNKIALRLRQSGVEVHCTREPGGTPGANALRQVFSSCEEKWNPVSELFIVSAARRQHVDMVLRPKLAKGVWVLCDRYADSSRVYQGYLGGVPQDFLETVLRGGTDGLEPELTLVLDCSVEQARERREKRGAIEDGTARYDDAEQATQETLRRGFLELAQEFPDRVKVIDASQSEDRVEEEAWQWIETKRQSIGAN